MFALYAGAAVFTYVIYLLTRLQKSNEKTIPEKPLILTKLYSKRCFISLLVFGFISFVYFISSSYVLTSNDGSHFALIRSIVDFGTLEISHYLDYTYMVDFAFKDGVYYSDRIPGTA